MPQNPYRYPLVRVTAARRIGVPLGEFAAATGLHPDLVRRYVALGLLEPATGPAGQPCFDTTHLMRLARIQRLRSGLGLNYAALGVVLDLLDRIDQLEAALAGRAATGRR
ncbi:chaperone modulator CbpM [Kitasatospora sp. NPDC127111]|uniref:chaperone modulator CbpM n=1 Tax=Kitasatospora sp. NPDC127111 TaxID=3345363 RepID=UPI00362580C5